MAAGAPGFRVHSENFIAELFSTYCPFAFTLHGQWGYFGMYKEAVESHPDLDDLDLEQWIFIVSVSLKKLQV